MKISSLLLFRHIHLPYSLNILFVGFQNDVMRTMLCFQINFGNILTDNSHAKQLDSANKSDDAHKRCPSIDRITENKFSDRNNNYHNKCYQC